MIQRPRQDSNLRPLSVSGRPDSVFRRNNFGGKQSKQPEPTRKRLGGLDANLILLDAIDPSILSYRFKLCDELIRGLALACPSTAKRTD